MPGVARCGAWPDAEPADLQPSSRPSKRARKRGAGNGQLAQAAQPAGGGGSAAKPSSAPVAKKKAKIEAADVCLYHNPVARFACGRGKSCRFEHVDTRVPEFAALYKAAWGMASKPRPKPSAKQWADLKTMGIGEN